jgi:Fic family protein
MVSKFSPSYEITHTIIKKLTEVSQREGQLKATALSAKNKIDISYLANIDAVHFSTKLEGNLLTYKQVTDVLDGNLKSIKEQKDLKEVINYSKARSVVLEQTNRKSDLNKGLILKIHKTLLNDIVTGKLLGYYRNSQNVIRDSNTNSIVYMPPEHTDVDILMKGLMQWVKRSILEDVSPFIVAAIFHYYFVTIHPFLDGNGRSARLLTGYLLLSNNITISEYASLEKQHENNRPEYYKQLRQAQAPIFYDIQKDIDLTPWINYWLDCLLNTYEEGLLRCSKKIITLEQEYMDDRLQKTISLFRKHKRLRASEYQILMGLGRTQAVDDLNKLIDKNIIQRVGGGRSQTYIIK